MVWLLEQVASLEWELTLEQMVVGRAVAADWVGLLRRLVVMEQLGAGWVAVVLSSVQLLVLVQMEVAMLRRVLELAGQLLVGRRRPFRPCAARCLRS